jgi:hypothetical protein
MRRLANASSGSTPPSDTAAHFFSAGTLPRTPPLPASIFITGVSAEVALTVTVSVSLLLVSLLSVMRFTSSTQSVTLWDPAVAIQ